MRKTIFVIFIIIILISISSCTNNTGVNSLVVVSIDNKLNDDRNLYDFKLEYGSYAGKIVESFYGENWNENQNIVFSPLTTYMCLCMSANLANEDVASEIYEAIGISKEDIETYSKYLVNNYIDDKSSFSDELFNSYWIKEGYFNNKDIFNDIANYYLANSYSYKDKNVLNKYLSKYIEEKSHKLLKWDKSSVDENTMMVLLSMHYIQDTWEEAGVPLNFLKDKYDFENTNGTKKHLNLIDGHYNNTNILEKEDCSIGITKTYNDYQILFLVPNDGYTTKDILNKNNIQIAVDCSYGYKREDQNYIYHTKCCFPEFKTEINTSINSTVKNMGINKLFEDGAFSNINNDLYVSDIIQNSKFLLDKKGIKGASYTIIPAGGSAGPGEKQHIYKTFVVDKAFCFVVLRKGFPYFVGCVNNL